MVCWSYIFLGLVPYIDNTWGYWDYIIFGPRNFKLRNIFQMKSKGYHSQTTVDLINSIQHVDWFTNNYPRVSANRPVFTMRYSALATLAMKTVKTQLAPHSKSSHSRKMLSKLPTFSFQKYLNLKTIWSELTSNHATHYPPYLQLTIHLLSLLELTQPTDYQTLISFCPICSCFQNNYSKIHRVLLLLGHLMLEATRTAIPKALFIMQYSLQSTIHQTNYHVPA